MKWLRIINQRSYYSGLRLALLFFSLSTHAQQGPATLNISGGLLSSNGTAVTSNHVNFKIEIRDQADTCTLYSEQHLALDLSTSKGAFSIMIGTGTSAANSLE